MLVQECPIFKSLMMECEKSLNMLTYDTFLRPNEVLIELGIDFGGLLLCLWVFTCIVFFSF